MLSYFCIIIFFCGGIVKVLYQIIGKMFKQFPLSDNKEDNLDKANQALFTL